MYVDFCRLTCYLFYFIFFYETTYVADFGFYALFLISLSLFLSQYSITVETELNEVELKFTISLEKYATFGWH